MNVIKRISIKKTVYYYLLLFAVGAVSGFGFCYVFNTEPEIKRAITERDQLIDEYRRIDAEAARDHQRLVERNRRLEEGLGGVRELTSGSIADIRSAINILAGVKSILETMEEDGSLWDTGGVSGGVDYRDGGAAMRWEPNEKQAIALTMRKTRMLLYGGARGGGKTDFLIIDYLNGVNEFGEHWNGIIFRKTYSQLEEIIRRGRQIYLPLGAEYHKAENSFTFPNGASLKLRYLENETDCENYQGHSYPWIGFDELGNYRSSYAVDTMLMCNRSAEVSEDWLRVRCTANPGGVGNRWLKERFIDGKQPYTSYEECVGEDDEGKPVVISSAFVPARVDDNKALMKANPGYKAMLMAQPEHIRKAMLDGCWDIKSGGEFFSEFDRAVHVIAPRILSGNWRRYYALDWGYKSPFALVKLAVSSDGKVIVYDEWYGQGTVEGVEKENVGLQKPSREVAARVAADMAREGVREIICDNSMWDERSAAPSDIDPFFEHGMVCVKSVKAKREGWGIVHELLTDRDEYGEPYLQIFSTCKYTIREMENIQCDKNDVELADSRMADHACDALRYGLYSDLYRRRSVAEAKPPRTSGKAARTSYDPTKSGYWKGGGGSYV